MPHGGASPQAGASSGSLNSLNSRLNGDLPSSDVSYSHRLYVNDIGQAVEEAQAEYFQKAAPPQGVLERALYIVRQGGLLGPPSIVYVLKRERILGIEICTGWEIVQPTGGGDPQGGYTFGPCGGEKFTPPSGLPTIVPKKAATPGPAST